MPAPDPILEAAALVQDFCRERGWRLCFIGGLAVLRWGEPRLTRGADVTLFTGYGSEEPYVTALLERFPDTAAFAMANRVVLLRAGDGVPIDVALGALPVEERAVERASDFPYSRRLVAAHVQRRGPRRPLLNLKGAPADAQRLLGLLECLSA